MSLFKRDILSFDFGASSVKAVVGKHTKKGVVVGKSFSIDLPEDLYNDGEIKDLDEMTNLLRNGLSDHKIGQLETNVVVNSTNIVMREVNLPMVNDDEVESIIYYQLEDYIPINPRDYVVKYLDLGTTLDNGEEKKKVLLVGVPNNIIQSHLTLLKNLEMKPSSMDYHGNAISKLVATGGAVNGNIDADSTVVCVDIGAKSTGISIVDEGTVMVARVIEMGSEDIINEIIETLPHLEREEVFMSINQIEDITKKPTGADDDSKVKSIVIDNLYELLEKIEMIFRYYRTRETSNEINLVLMYGGFTSVDGIDRLFKDFFAIEATILKSMSNISINDDLGTYANAVGALIRREEVKKK